MIGRQMSLVSWVWLVGVFELLLSSALGCFSGTSKILQAIGRDGVIADLRPLRHGVRWPPLTKKDSDLSDYFLNYEFITECDQFVQLFL